MSNAHWVTKGVDVQELDKELNAFQEQGFVIRWVFDNGQKPNWPDYLIIAEQRPTMTETDRPQACARGAGDE